MQACDWPMAKKTEKFMTGQKHERSRDTHSNALKSKFWDKKLDILLHIRRSNGQFHTEEILKQNGDQSARRRPTTDEGLEAQGIGLR